MSGHWIRLTRDVVFGVITVLSIIVLGLAAHSISSTTSVTGFSGGYYTFDAFAVAVSVMTWTSIPALWLIDVLRRGAITSIILVELVWFGVLWVLWLSSAALSSNDLNDVSQVCSGDFSLFEPDWWHGFCSETKAIVAFSWLIWFAFSGYLIALLVLSISAHNNGSPVWKSSVREATFSPVNVDLGGAMGTPATEHKSPFPQHTPMQQQHTLNQSYPPQPTQV